MLAPSPRAHTPGLDPSRDGGLEQLLGVSSDDLTQQHLPRCRASQVGGEGGLRDCVRLHSMHAAA